jgi:hypothetical protein
VQIFAVPEGVVPVGTVAPGVRVNGRVDCVPINNVGVIVTNGSGVGVACAAGEAHAVIVAANRKSPIENIKRVLVFMFFSSFNNYSPPSIYD